MKQVAYELRSNQINKGINCYFAGFVNPNPRDLQLHDVAHVPPDLIVAGRGDDGDGDGGGRGDGRGHGCR